MNADIYFPSGSGGWSLDQLFDFSPYDDNDPSKADEGLPGVGIKSETQADAPVGLEALCTSPAEGSLGLDWMEQDFDFGFTPLSLDDDLPSTSASTTFPSVAASISTSPGGTVENLHKEFADEFLHNLSETLLKQETPTSPSSYQEPTPEIHVTPEIVLDAIDTSASSPSCLDTAPEIQVTSEMILDAEDTSALQVLQNGNVIGFLQCPLTSDDVESLLSSASSLEPSPASTPSPASSSPSSPSSPATVDTSALSDSGYWSLNSSDLYKVVENTDKSRPTPYSRPKSSKNTKSKGRKQTASIAPTPTELELEFMSKKDRKKLQNKNAAIRYRQKKKAETEDKRSEVDELESINKDLHAKCEELQREVKCMKDLINDIRKAKGQPPLQL